jgi:hypothetical protein
VGFQGSAYENAVTNFEVGGRKTSEARRSCGRDCTTMARATGEWRAGRVEHVIFKLCMENPWTDDAQETDLATPSWSAGVGVRWADASLWNTASWSPPKSPYDDITLGKSPSTPIDSVDFQTAPTTPAPQKQLSLPSTPTPPPSTRRGSPYEFNTFETADVNVSFPQDSFAWPAQPWSPPADSQDQPQVDEWELAKIQKEKLDYHVVSLYSSLYDVLPLTD